MTARVILVEATPRQASDGVAVTVRLAGGGETVPYEYGGNLDWRAGIIGKPTLIASLEFAGGEFPPGSVPAAAELEWQGRDLAELADLVWRDAPITVRMGPEGAALPPVVLSGQVLEAVTTREGRLKISLSDPAAALRKPLAPGRFAGTGGLEGPVEWDGRVRTRVWGRVWNLAGEPIDKANNIYCFADPLRQIQAIDAVRDKGAAAAALSSLAWQGSAAATFAALQASVPPQGGGVVCPSLACVKWWTQPAGDLCADLRGETAGGYVETTAQVIQRLVSAIGGPALAATELASAIAARPAPIGWVVRDEQTTVAAMLDELAGNSSLMWLINSAGEIVLRPWAWGASVASVQSHQVARLKTLRPVATRKIGYQRNELPMKRGDLAAIVLAEGVEYADGTPIEDLRPAEIGATDGAQTGVNLVNGAGSAVLTDPQIVTAQGTAAAIAGQGALATQNNVNLGTQVTGALGTANAAAGLVNANISIAANGSLAGGGGGQVTIGGLGYTGALNATYGARSGTNIYRTDGTTVLSQAEIRTAEGVASAIAGQGSLATKNAANWATEVTGTGKPENNATNSDNMVRNPTLQSGTGEWSGLSNIARTTPTSTDPGFYWRTTGSGTATANSGALLPLPAGSSTIFVSALVRGSGGNPYWNIACYFYDEANIYLGMGQVNMFTGTGGWNARKATIAIPNRAASYQVVVTGQANGGTSTDLYGLRIAPTELAATLGARLGSNLQNSAATVVLGDADVITAAGVAASVVGQGALATKNSATWSSDITGTGKPQDNADVTALAQVSVALTTDQTIPATYNGTVTTEDLANIVWTPVVTRGGSSIKLANGTTYALANASGGTFAVDNTNGSGSKGNVTISAMSSNIARVELTITVDGVVQPKLLLKVTKNLGAPPSSGGSTPKTVTWGAGEFATLNTTSYTPVVTALKTVALASGESLYGTAPLTYNVTGTNTPPLNRTMTFKWQYSVAGANSWNDFASPITGSTASCADFANEISAVPGTVAVTQTKSGLSAGNYDVRLVAICSATGRNMSTSGTATVEAKV